MLREVLAGAMGDVISREKLMEEVAGRDWDPNDRSIDVHVGNLRKKLEAGARRSNFTRTMRGAGYKLVVADG
ncbi:MAG TPA: helix-turn-helix domain-containing protein [Magnetospirillaceae bacterium]|jgi:DNA-binding response OmpR family regulator